MPSRILSPTLLIGAPKKTTDKLQRVYVTLRHESSRIRASATGDSLMSGEGSYTAGLDVVDWVRFGSESAFRCRDVCTTWLLDTCPLSASPSPAFLVADTCDQLTAVIWTFPVPDWLHTADVHLLTPAHQTGTHFLPTSEIIVFLCQLSNATLRPFSSLSISTRNAFGFFYENALLLLKWRAVIVSNIHISSSSSSGSKPMTH